MSISFQEVHSLIVRFVFVLQVLNRRAGPLDMSGHVCMRTSTRVLDVSVSEVCVCVPLLLTTSLLL